MPRTLSVLLLLTLAGCGGAHQGPTPSPAPAGSLGQRVNLPPAPVIDSELVAADFAAEGRLAADSAADEAVLEELATAHPDADEPENKSEEGAEGGANAIADAVTWDIDVATYNSHDRVQYYLVFVHSRGRESLGFWLCVMPRFEAILRVRLQRQ
jgi:hypothetical protein